MAKNSNEYELPTVAVGTSSDVLVADVIKPRLVLVGEYNQINLGTVKVFNGYAYVGDMGESKIKIIDVSDPENPTLVGEHAASLNGKNSLIKNNYFYHVKNYDDLMTFNISDSENIILENTYNNSGKFSGFVINGNYLYFAAGYNQGFKILDISNHTNPQFNRQVSFGGSAEDVDVSGDYIYIANNTQGLKIFDISNLSNIIETTSRSFGSSCNQVISKGDYIYLACVSSVVVVDVSDPYVTNRVSDIYTGGMQKMFIDNNYLYTGGNNKTLGIYDISNPLSPYLSMEYNSGVMSNINDIYTEDNFIYVISSHEGLKIFRILD